MFLIDQYAYTNKFKNVHPMEKLFFSITTLVIVVASECLVIHLTVLLIMICATIALAGIPWRFYFKLMLIPSVFLLVGLLTLIIQISNVQMQYIFSVSIGSYCIGITSEGVYNGVQVFVKSITATSCLFFLILSTSFTDILHQLSKLKIPKLILEIMMLIYRFIFVLLEASLMIFVSQASRLGYSSLKKSFISFGKLISMMFIKAYNHSQELYISLISRGYDGTLKSLENEYRYNPINIIIIFLFEMFILGFLV